MDVNAEAKRILAMSISKLYSSRSQRGGLRLHRSLLLSLVMRSARDIYHTAHLARLAEDEPMDHSGVSEARTPSSSPAAASAAASQENPEELRSPSEEETAEDKENVSPTRQSRKRRGKTSVAPDFLPSKRARLEPGEERHAVAGLGSCRTGLGETLTALSFNPLIPAC